MEDSQVGDPEKTRSFWYGVPALAGLFASANLCGEALERTSVVGLTLAGILGVISLGGFLAALMGFSDWLKSARPKAYSVWTHPLFRFGVAVALLLGLSYLDADYYSPVLLVVVPNLGIFALIFLFMALERVSRDTGSAFAPARARGFWVIALSAPAVVVTQIWPELRFGANLLISFMILVLCIDIGCFFSDREEYHAGGNNIGYSLLAGAILAAGFLTYAQGLWSL